MPLLQDRWFFLRSDGINRLLVFLFIVLSLNYHSQSQSLWSIEQYTTREGLPNDVITALTKDQEGFLWIGTNKGLVRFDGIHFVPYQPHFRDSIQFSNSQITGLFISDEANLWISSRGGLTLCNIYTHECQQIVLPEHLDASRDNDWVGGMVQSGPFAWGITSQHLIKLDLRDNKLEFFLLPRIQPTFFTFSGLAVDNRGIPWMTIDYEVFSFDPVTRDFRARALDANEKSQAKIEAWSIASDGANIWCGTREQGLFHFDSISDRFIPYTDTDFFVRCITRVNDEIWLGGGSSGLYRLTSGRIQPEDFSQIFPNGHNGSWANKIFYDSSLQLVWVGTQDGLEKIDLIDPHFSTWKIPVTIEQDFPPFVLNVIQDRSVSSNHEYWLKIIDKGLYHWSKSENQFYLIPGIQVGKSNECLIQDGLGRIWLNQYDTPKLQIYDPGHKRVVNPPVPKPYLDCSYLYNDSKGNVWIGTFDNKIGRYDPFHAVFQELVMFQDLISPDNETDIVCITEDTKGQIWVITEKELFRLSPDQSQVSLIDISGFIPEGTILLSLLGSSDGHMWLGTREGAFEMDIDGRLLRQFRSEDPVPLSYVFQMVEDLQNRLWFGTAHGLYCLSDRDNFLYRFDKQDGLLGDNAYFLSNDEEGNIYVGFPAAINSLNPSDWYASSGVVPLAITELRVLDQPRQLRTGEPLLLRPGENFFTVRFGLLKYRETTNDRYEYRLSGFEDQWHILDYRDHLTYTNLDEGRYDLELKATTYQGVNHQYRLTLAVQVIPPFYKTIWFRLLIAVILLSTIGAFWYNRYSQNQRLQALRSRIARDLHDEVGSSLSSIRFFSEYVLHLLDGNAPVADQHLRRIGQSASDITENIREIVWALQARSYDLQSLVLKIREYGSKLMESRHIQFSGEVDPAFMKLKMDIYRQRNLYLICKESFNNAAKYSGGTHIEWKIKVYQSKKCCLTIQDNGQGFDPTNITPGSGLINLKKRAEEMNAKFDLSSQVGKGVKIKVEWE